jgi:sugar lactone lactonase YvrE
MTYDISGDQGGLAVDQQGHVYIGGADDIHRLSPDGTFRDIVLSKHDGVDRPRKYNTISLSVLTTTDHSFHYTISSNYDHDQLISLLQVNHLYLEL